MLNFVLGRKGSGKTTYIHKKLGSLSEKGEKTVLVVPKQFTFESDRSVLSLLGPRLASQVEVLSFSRLADVVFKSCRKISKPILKDSANAVFMSLALDSLEEKLVFFSRHRSSVEFVKKMLGEVARFKKEAVSPKELFDAAAALEDGFLKKKTYETALIYETYNTLLEESFFDDRDLLSAVFEILGESSLFEDAVVAFDGFASFSGQEMKIIELLLKRAKDVYVTLCTDDIFDQNGLGPFSFTGKTGRRLFSLAKKIGVEVASPVVLGEAEAPLLSRTAALEFLEKNLFDPLSGEFGGEEAEIEIYSAPTLREECAFAASKIHALLRSGNYRCRDIAVVFRSGEAYQKEMRYNLLKFGVPIFEDRRASVQNEPLCVLVRAIFEIYSNGLTLESLMKYAKTGLSPLSWDEIAEVENYAFMWSLESSALAREWKDNPDGFGVPLDEERKERLALLNETKNRLVEPLLSLRESLKEKNASEVLRAVFEFLLSQGVDERLKEYAIALEEEGKAELALEQERVWDALVGVFDDLSAALGERAFSPKRLFELFEIALSSQSLGKLPDGFDEVYICDAGRIQTRSFKVVFVVGANDGVFPATFGEQGVFNHFETERLEEFIHDFGEGPIDLAAKERFLVYCSLCAAKDKLFVSYSLTDQSGIRLSSSEIVSTLKELFPSVREKVYPFEDEREMIESENAAFEFMAENWHENTVFEASLKEYFSKKEDFSGKLRALSAVNEKKAFSFEDPEKAKALFGTRMKLSASQLEIYGECPFKYFCRYGLRAKERKTASLDPASMGTVVHEVLEKLLSNHRGSKIRSLSREQAQKEIKELLEDYMNTYMGGARDKSSRFLYLYERLFKTLCAISDRLLCEFGESDFEPVAFELSISEDGAVKPTRIPLRHGYIELFGVVDRVDEMKTGEKNFVRVVDYKTGKKDFSLADVFAGLGMQMLLYLFSIWKNGSGEFKNVVPSGVLYLPARIEPFEAERRDETEALREKQFSKVKMDGLILDDGEVIKGMDNALSGRFIPIKVNKKSGALSGKFISLSQLERLSKVLEKIMADMGNNLHEGKIPAFPVSGTGHANTCDFCDFKSVCRAGKNVKKRKIEKLSHGECLDILDGKEE